MKRRETQESIYKWALDTFGRKPGDRLMIVAARANEEMAEMLSAIAQGRDVGVLAGEMADVAIMLYQCASIIQRDLGLEVDAKMAINRAREWEVDGLGIGQHKETTEGLPSAASSVKVNGSAAG